MWVSPPFLRKGGLRHEDKNFYFKAFKICRIGCYKSCLIGSGYKNIRHSAYECHTLTILR